MDPALDPPPVSAQGEGLIPAPYAAAGNPTPFLPVAHNHPPYAEMVTAAISALNEPEGSSKKAIAKYIETHYTDIPPTHSALLTHHLKSLKASGQLLMVKYSYKLPTAGSAAASVNGGVNAVSPDLASSMTKKRPGRPPKPKPDSVQAAVPVFGAPINVNAEPGGLPAVHPPPENLGVFPVNGLAAGGSVRGRGRPPKRGRGRPPKSGGAPPSGGGAGRRRGRPKKNAFAPVVARGKGPGRPRGRPPKPINVVEGLAPGAVPVGEIPAVPVPVGTPVTGKRRGRPPKAGGAAKKARYVHALLPRKPRKLSGKPLGRPRKNGARATESHLQDAYLKLKEKLKNLSDLVKNTANLIRPSLNSEAAVNALLELEVAAEKANAPPNAPLQQPPPVQHPLVQPPLVQPPPQS